MTPTPLLGGGEVAGGEDTVTGGLLSTLTGNGALQCLQKPVSTAVTLKQLGQIVRPGGSTIGSVGSGE